MDKKQLDELIALFDDQYDELLKTRARNAERHSMMTKEELAESLERDMEEVMVDAAYNKVTIGAVPVDETTTETENGGPDR